MPTIGSAFGTHLPTNDDSQSAVGDIANCRLPVGRCALSISNQHKQARLCAVSGQLSTLKNIHDMSSRPYNMRNTAHQTNLHII